MLQNIYEEIVKILTHRDRRVRLKRASLAPARGRNYFREKFGTDEEHEKWLSLIDAPYRKELGQGYRDGFYFK